MNDVVWEENGNLLIKVCGKYISQINQGTLTLTAER